MVYHESIPGHGGKKLVEQIGKAQFIDNPVITVTVDYGFIEIENHNNSSHFFSRKKEKEQKT